MDNIIKSEYFIYLEKSKFNSIKESWVKNHLPNLYDYILDKLGVTISEKIYLLYNDIGKCKICDGGVKFLSIERGYRDYCSKKCSNNDKELIDSKLKSYKETCISKWGVDNSSKSDDIKTKIKDSKKNTDYLLVSEKAKNTFLKNWGVDNPSKSKIIKQKKKETTLANWGVDNPFQSDEIKEKIKETNLEKWGVNHPLKSSHIKERVKLTNLEKWGSENYKSSEFDKIGTLLSNDSNYIKYLNELYDFIKSIYDGEIIQSHRDGLEIDIYLPNLNLGFEFNGLYWHSDKFKDKWYHINKTNYFKERGIRIIHIWEDDWVFKNEIIRSQIKNWLGIIENKIWARKCQIREIDDISLIRDFLDKNHIQGFVRSSLKIGLFKDDELVSLMIFDHAEGRKTMGSDEWNLSRFCNKINTSVIGSASKLLNYFISKWNPIRIITFADKDWSIGDLYFKLGFSKVNESNPNYKYVIGDIRVNKQRFKKSNLIGKGYDPLKSESQIMIELGYNKVYDCGQIKFQIDFFIEK